MVAAESIGPMASSLPRRLSSSPHPKPTFFIHPSPLALYNVPSPPLSKPRCPFGPAGHFPPFHDLLPCCASVGHSRESWRKGTRPIHPKCIQSSRWPSPLKCLLPRWLFLSFFHPPFQSPFLCPHLFTTAFGPVNPTIGSFHSIKFGQKTILWISSIYFHSPTFLYPQQSINSPIFRKFIQSHK